MRMVKLSNWDTDRDVWIDPEAVETVQEWIIDKGTRIDTKSSQWFHVKEAPLQVLTIMGLNDGGGE